MSWKKTRDFRGVNETVLLIEQNLQKDVAQISLMRYPSPVKNEKCLRSSAG